MRSSHSLLALMAATLVAACGSDSSSSSDGTPTTPTTPSANAPNVAVDSGFADRTAVVGSSLPARVHVTQNGQPASGVTVTWSVSTGGGTVNPTTSTTDATGLATTTWTLNDTVRVSVLTAAVVGASSATLQVTTTAGPPAAVVKVSPDSIGVVAGASTLITVQVKDKSGNPVSGVRITWTATGGALTLTNGTTGPSGNGQVVFSTESAKKSYTVTATAANLGALTFKVVGL